MTSKPDSADDTCDRLQKWDTMWEEGRTGFHRSHVTKMLQKHFEKLKTNGKLKNIFVPLCGKSLDMKWLADQGIVTVGVEGVLQALNEFFAENNLEKTETEIKEFGPSGKLLQSKDGMLKLYCGDMMQFSVNIEGTFDGIWDRGSLVALDREDVPSYVKILKSLMNPGSRILMEITQYDLQQFEGWDESDKPPPPHSMNERQLKELFEPECTVEEVDREAVTFFRDKNLNMIYYLIIKT